MPRVGLGVRLRGIATAAIDVSDGLVGDLGHILESSGAGAAIEVAALPTSPALAAKLEGGQRALALQCALAGGDDYELCFCAPPAARAKIAQMAAALVLPLTRIGGTTEARMLVVRDANGAPLRTLPRAYDHFAP